jgi:hypothetical protein
VRDREQHRKPDRQRGRPRSYDGREPDVATARQGGWIDSEERRDEPRRGGQAEARTDPRQEQHFDRHLSNEAGSAGTQREPDAELTPSNLRVCEQQRDDVAARDEQHGRHGRRDEDNGASNVTHDRLVQRLQHDPFAVAIRPRIQSRQLSCDSGEVGRRQADRRRWGEACDRFDPSRPA